MHALRRRQQASWTSARRPWPATAAGGSWLPSTTPLVNAPAPSVVPVHRRCNKTTVLIRGCCEQVFTTFSPRI